MKLLNRIKMLRKKLKLDPTVTKTTDTHFSTSTDSKSSIAEKFLKLEIDLNESLKEIQFVSPVAYVYRPLDYALKPHEVFTKRYCLSPKKILFVGMNPGPWGMCQTGIPFGEINIVKEWFKITEEVLKPEKECPGREVVGMQCTRSEISGQRIWGLFKNLCETPENFFRSAYMYNYCPIAMMKNTGVNITPTEVQTNVQRELEEVCDATLFKVIQLLKAEVVVGVGKFAEQRALKVLKNNNPLGTKVLYLLHPSPRVPKNQNWVANAEKKLDELNLLSYFKH